MLSLDSVTAGSSSIFGGAKPVDTAAREKEIEERLLKDKQAQKERKEVREYFHARKPNRSYFCLCKKIIDLSLFLFLSLSLSAARSS